MKLKAYRKLRNLTLEQTAEQLDVNTSTVCRWENGTIPKPDEMRRIWAWSQGAVTANDFFYKDRENG